MAEWIKFGLLGFFLGLFLEILFFIFKNLEIFDFIVRPLTVGMLFLSIISCEDPNGFCLPIWLFPSLLWIFACTMLGSLIGLIIDIINAKKYSLKTIPP